MQRIGVLTSGGDAPGMNAAVRAVVRKCIYYNIEVLGIERGYSGLINGEFKKMELGSVADIIHRGGTILRTARCPEFVTKAGQEKALSQIRDFGLEGLVVIGGDGSFRGAMALGNTGVVKTIGLPGTIDNDIACTDVTIGFDTAMNTICDAINKLRDTATSHERVFVLEVMGRDSGALALHAGLAGGAESILIPEIDFDINQICSRLMRGYERGKLHSIILVAEGAASGIAIGEAIKKCTGMDTRVTILGHLQRGGTPTAFDRNIASRMASRAVDFLREGRTNLMVGLVDGEITGTELTYALGQRKVVDEEIFELAKILAI
ncbi:6-phosphofructokinase [Candidatus Contubernalis alkaliaceticus]|uniref:6-phosphofructokinase n=1 Tax=Candidatus Contubernalis alkaliaceticus TaxID=338645 RepID=UPI001F4C199E|nr:6-phosphofructokinase [Candidatus Contubernalis alkalaceticus]UNC91538.1 6-phosphofructokinase [Candidatus Contubernalis alkalaceticus]